jgi:hypothetical protein
MNSKKGGDIMKAVLITYKSSSRTRIVPQASVRAIVVHIYHQRQREVVINALGTIHRSPITDGPGVHWPGRGSSDIHCWKRRSKKACRGWQRHPKRTVCKRRTRFGYKRSYSPSARLLYQQDLFSKMGLPE